MKYNFLNISKEDSGKFEFLKILLLLQVVVGHAISLCWPQMHNIEIVSVREVILIFLKSIFSYGRLSAFLFIFLSGFFTARIFLDFTHPFLLLKSIKKRIVRIYPVFIIALIFTLCLDWTGMVRMGFIVYDNNQMEYIVSNHYSILLFLTNSLSLQPTFFDTFGTNSPLWTLGYLLQYYVITSILRFFVTKSICKFSLLVGAFVILTGVFNLEFALLWAVWYTGALMRISDMKSLIFNKVILSSFIVMLLIICKVWLNKYVSMLLSPFIGFLLLQIVIKTPKIDFSKITPKHDISYCLYAIHMPILFFLYGCLGYLWDNEIFSLWQGVVYIILCLSLSVIVSMSVLKITSYTNGRKK